MADISKPYAEALYEMAIENGSLDAVYQEVFDVLGIFRREPEFAGMLQNPRIPPEDKEALIGKAFRGMNGNLSGLLALMLKKGRGAYMEAALQEFIRLTKEYKGFIHVRVYSAVALTEGEMTSLKAQLASKTGRQAEVEAYVDPSLIGGLLIKAGGMVLDGTIKKRLLTLKRQMA